MFKKIFLILFILIEIHSFSPSFLQTSKLSWPPFSKTDMVMAAEQNKPAINSSQAQEPSWKSYILPGTLGGILIVGIGSYWLFFRKKLV